MTTFEVPMQDGPLDNPEWTEEQNRRFDKLQETLSTAAARRIVLGEDAPADMSQQSTEEPREAKGPSSKKTKRPINQPSRNFRIYDRDKSVSDYYDSIDPLKG